ncbi:MAG: hypothetical protein HWD58_11390 [Bacteroidota bacterium]|nr:MAG: hypothetical protein HWD58_11390 [Bacteroidota bacterium]
MFSTNENLHPVFRLPWGHLSSVLFTLLFKLASDNAGNSGISPETAAMYESARFSRLSITPELRYYFKKKRPRVYTWLLFPL